MPSICRISTPSSTIWRRSPRPSDVILTQGAGSVWKVGEAFLNRIKGAREG